MTQCDIQVPAGGTALADALDQAPAGARLCLAPGEHTAGVALQRSVTIVGTDGAAATVVKSPGRGAVLRIDEDGLSVRLEGLTVQGGLADAGGGLSVRGRGKVQVHDCVFRHNGAGMVGGGGLYARAGLLQVEKTAFEANKGRQGGGVFLDMVVRAELVRCTFRDNEAELGGALRVTEGVEAELKACRFAANRAGTDGAALHVSGTKSRVPTVALHFAEIAPEGVTRLVNGPEIPGQVRLKNSKVPASWRQVTGVTDHGGNTFR